MLVRPMFLLIALSTLPAMAGVDPFIRPDGSPTAKPVWGVRGGIQIGLSPVGGGPRGLLRVFAPYLGADRIFNFIAVEPIANGHRDLSELQPSAIDHKPGKLMWTVDSVDLAHPPAYIAAPARGVVTSDGDAKVLSLFLLVEKFENGARPILKLSLRTDQPHELTLQTFAAVDSVPMRSCVLTATMGNYARLRHLHLKDRIVEASNLFRGPPNGTWDFYPWFFFFANETLATVDGRLTVSATGDTDRHPILNDVPLGWRYQGKPAVQTWSTPARPDVVARVNGRSTFWGTHARIPGGPAFENFELLAPFGPGDEFRFAVDEQR